MQPIVEGMGLDWKSQYSRLMRDRERYGVVVMTTPSSGGPQQSICIPLRRLFGWLMTIQPSRVRPQSDSGAFISTKETKLFALLGLTRARYGHGDIGYNVVSMNVAQVLLYFLEEEPDMEDGWFVRSCGEIGRKAGMTRNATYKALRHAVKWKFLERRTGGWPSTNRIPWHRLDPQLAKDYAETGLLQISAPLSELQIAALPKQCKSNISFSVSIDS
jgi:hypothetical protein